MLSTTTSHKTYKYDKIVMNGSDYFKIKAITENNYGSGTMEVLYEKNKGLLLRHNGNKIRRLEFMKIFPIIFFSPEDIEIIKGSPLQMRRLFNIFISQIDNDYLKTLIRYNKALKSRNTLLRKDVKNEESVKVWTIQLKNESKYIYKRREDFVSHINKKLMELCKKMKLEYDLQLKYIMSLYSEEKTKNDTLKKFTTWGPHRDILKVMMNGKEIKDYGSRGELRMSAFLLKLIFWEILKEMTEKNPVLLLDDVFSELDKDKRKRITDNLDEATQIIMSATYLPEDSSIEGNVINL